MFEMSHAHWNNGRSPGSSKAAFPSFRTSSERPAPCLFPSLIQHPRNFDVLTVKYALKSLSCLISMSCRPRMLLDSNTEVQPIMHRKGKQIIDIYHGVRQVVQESTLLVLQTRAEYFKCIICISNFQIAQAAPPRVCPTTWCFALRLQMPDFLTAEEVCDVFRSIFNDTQQAIPGLEGKEVSHIFADICTPRARLLKPLSKDGFPTPEYRPKPLAGHLYGLAKIVTAGRTPKFKPSLPHARTAAGNSSTA